MLDNDLSFPECPESDSWSAKSKISWKRNNRAQILMF